MTGEPDQRQTSQEVVSAVPKGILVSGLLAASFIAVVIAGWLLLQILDPIRPAITGIAFAILLTGLLLPLKNAIARIIPNGHAAAGVTMVVFLGALLGTIYITGAQLVAGFEELSDSVFAALEEIEVWLREGPIGSDAGFSEYLARAQDWLTSNSSQLLGGAVAAGSAVGTFTVVLGLALVTTFFFLADGRRIWLWFVGLLPDTLEDRIDVAFSSGFHSVRAYVRTQAVVAAVDAVGIGIGAWILGLPLVIPLTIVVFLTAFIPVVGAFAAGALVVLIAWFTQGLTAALIMLGIVLLVQQVEGNLLQPILMSRAVALHPWGVIIGVAAGSYIYGIVGALFAVPVMAMIKVVVQSLRRQPSPDALPDGPTKTDWTSVLANARTLGQRARPSRVAERRGRTGPADNPSADNPSAAREPVTAEPGASAEPVSEDGQAGEDVRSDDSGR